LEAHGQLAWGQGQDAYFAYRQQADNAEWVFGGLTVFNPESIPTPLGNNNLYRCQKAEDRFVNGLQLFNKP